MQPPQYKTKQKCCYGGSSVYHSVHTSLLASVHCNEPLVWFEAPGISYTINNGSSPGLLSDILMLSCVAALYLQDWSLHMVQQFINGVNVGMGQQDLRLMAAELVILPALLHPCHQDQLSSSHDLLGQLSCLLYVSGKGQGRRRACLLFHPCHHTGDQLQGQFPHAHFLGACLPAAPIIYQILQLARSGVSCPILMSKTNRFFSPPYQPLLTVLDSVWTPALLPRLGL